MHHIKRTRFSTKSRWSSVMKSCNGLCEYMPRKCVSDVGVAGFSSTATERIAVNDFAKRVRVRIGSPVTGYGQESRNRAARQQFPNRIWTDEDGIEHVEVNFYVRGPHGTGRVYT
ncbi:hypothetical protein F0562_019051 [Nyssa sinensis]|uniref:Mitochondrial import inner membrane translocase subunit Tim21 n=1 Tax=Nyssa sinensis TaxID=561372 RepID=A0A5J4ZDU4_9ASTE|nr:hypothetical protein F0562_019051 [Nyssa sinensis]